MLTTFESLFHYLHDRGCTLYNNSKRAVVIFYVHDGFYIGQQNLHNTLEPPARLS